MLCLFYSCPPCFRAWTGGGGREAGSWEQDAVQTGITSLSSRYVDTWHGIAGPLDVLGDVTETLSTDPTTALQGTSIGEGYVRWTVNQRMADETRPVNIAIPVIIYLGEYT